MIVATAGHVDHGKTSLIRALTSIDTDRLPEERRRGMTIDLGFAYLWPESGAGQPPIDAIGFIDVPGHERFVRNLLCGLAGIDLALLVIAADDGPMPQTNEHLSILGLLGVQRVAVVLTKIDRVTEARTAQARAEIEALLKGSALSAAPLFPVSTFDGRGVEELRTHLLDAARRSERRASKGNFRLSVDRAFTAAGTGLVVTGTAASGSVRVGDSVRAPDGSSLRVRSLHVHNQPADSGGAGQRCALNLVGAGDAAAAISRGDWIVSPRAPSPVARFDVHLQVLASEPKPLAHWAPIQVHLGTARANARVAWLGAESVEPGNGALAQLVLEHPIGAVHGDRFVVRDPSSRRTIGGGSVIDIFPPSRGRAKPERLAYLAAMAERDDAAALRRLLDACPGGLRLATFRANRNLGDGEAEALFEQVPMERVATSEGPVGFSPSRWMALERQALESVAQWHRDSPRTLGMPEDRVLHASGASAPRALAIGVARELARRNRLVRSGGTLRLASHRPAIDEEDEALWRRIAPQLARNALRPPSLHELAASLGETPERIESALEQSARLARVVRVSPKRYYTTSALRRLGEIARDAAEADPRGEVSAIAFRDRSGIGRNVSIEVLEYFDRVRLTQRRGNARRVLRPPGDVFAGDEPRPS